MYYNFKKPTEWKFHNRMFELCIIYCIHSYTVIQFCITSRSEIDFLEHKAIGIALYLNFLSKF